jgi:WD40 repeat protein
MAMCVLSYSMLTMLTLKYQLRQVQTIQRPGSITQACWHPTDSSLISLVGEEKTVELWDIRGDRNRMECPIILTNAKMHCSQS